jgi:hypothetical protein
MEPEDNGGEGFGADAWEFGPQVREPAASVEASDFGSADGSGLDVGVGFSPFEVKDDPDNGAGGTVIFQERTEEVRVMPVLAKRDIPVF